MKVQDKPAFDESEVEYDEDEDAVHRQIEVAAQAGPNLAPEVRESLRVKRGAPRNRNRNQRRGAR
jgi:hypothetical protein